MASLTACDGEFLVPYLAQSPSTGQLWFYALVVVAAVAMVFVVSARRRSHAKFVQTYAADEVCEHLHPALDLLKSRGAYVVRAGQKAPDLPLEVHLSIPFDPNAIYDELKLEPPAHVSERGVLYCKEDWCELHPYGRRVAATPTDTHHEEPEAQEDKPED